MLVRQPFAQLLDRGLVAEAVEHHVDFLLRQCGRNAEPDAAGRAGYDCCFACQHEKRPPRVSATGATLQRNFGPARGLTGRAEGKSCTCWKH